VDHVARAFVADSGGGCEQGAERPPGGGHDARRDDLEERDVDDAQIDPDGSVAVYPGKHASQWSSLELDGGWAQLPRDEVVKIEAVDHRTGGTKGLAIGAATGFVLTTLAVYGLVLGMAPQNECGLEGGPGGCGGSGGPSPGGALVAGMAVGLLASAATGGIGYLIGRGVGDGTTVNLTPPAAGSGSDQARR
jgi:hypothetical protein